MKISIGETLVVSVLGMAVVFVVLLLLMIIIHIMTRVVRGASKKAAPAVVAAPAAVPARGSCGQISIFDVPDRTAAMIMAIVADELGTPLNELRFVSIKEAEDKT